MGLLSDWFGTPETWSDAKLQQKTAELLSRSIHDADEEERKQAKEQAGQLLRIYMKRKGKL